MDISRTIIIGNIHEFKNQKNSVCFAANCDRKCGRNAIGTNRDPRVGAEGNYTAGAAEANSENVLVIWNDTDLAASFLKHWQSRWDQGSAFTSKY